MLQLFSICKVCAGSMCRKSLNVSIGDRKIHVYLLASLANACFSIAPDEKYESSLLERKSRLQVDFPLMETLVYAIEAAGGALTAKHCCSLSAALPTAFSSTGISLLQTSTPPARATDVKVCMMLTL